jgi:Icc-related predicted phosphoesterase
VVLSGHIHNSPFHSAGSWVDQIGRTWVFNPGKQIGPCPTYISIDTDTMEAEWISLDGRSLRQLAVANG